MTTKQILTILLIGATYASLIWIFTQDQSYAVGGVAGYFTGSWFLLATRRPRT